ncbi:MAG: amidohydrolase [Candidatus Bathyarchaeia archaeon]
MEGVIIFDSETGTIVDFGNMKEVLKIYTPEKIFGGEDSLILPGFINAHTHVAMTLFRGIRGDVSGFAWLHQVWEAEKQLTYDDVYAGALLGIGHAVKSGITTFADHYFFSEAVAEAAIRIGVRAVLARTFMDLVQGPKGHDTPESSINFAKSYKNYSPLVSTMLGPHSVYTCSQPALEKIVEASQDLNIRIHLHLSESRDEVKLIKEKHRMSPITYAFMLGLLDNALIAHMAYIKPQEWRLFKKTNVAIAYCPFTKLRGGQTIAPICGLLKYGVTVGLGTDGPASTYSLDMFREMRTLLAAQNYRYSSPQAITPRDALRLATLEGAKALGLDPLVGSIEIGKKADLVVLEMDVLKAWSIFKDPYQTVVYAGTPNDVRHVFINGRPVVIDRKLVNICEKDIIHCASSLARHQP